MKRAPTAVVAAFVTFATLASGCAPAARDTTVVHLDPLPPAPIADVEEPLPLEEPPPPKPRREARADRDAAQDDVADERTRARALFQEGAEAYAQSDFHRAREKFQAAYDLVAEPALLFNIASAELKLGDKPAACRLFRKYVAIGDPADPRIQEVQRQVGQQCRNVP